MQNVDCTAASLLSTTPLRVRNMTNVELSLFIEENYPISGRGRNRKPRYGVGVNDAHYITTPIVNGKQVADPSYSTWVSMLQRAYDPKFHVTNPTYVGVTVCEDWHSFSAFRAWWLNSHREDWHLDKDLLAAGNREYAPDACVYVPLWLNNFTLDRGASRGELPIGVSIRKQTGKYRSSCCNTVTGKQHTIGLFTTKGSLRVVELFTSEGVI